MKTKEERFDEVLALHSKMLRDAMTASSCQGRMDWDRAHDSEEAFENARDEFVKLLK